MSIIQDLRHALRVLARTKGWIAVVLVSLSLGIGANTALFSAVNGLMLETIPVAAPERLVRFAYVGQNDMVRSSSDYGYGGVVGGRNVRSTFSRPMFDALRAANQTLTDLAAGAPMGSVNVIVNGDAQFATAYEATGNYFRVLGVDAALGRVLVDADDRVEAPLTAVLSDAFWRKRFGGDPTVLNRAVTVNGQAVTIVGVLPPTFTSPQQLGADAADVFVPLAFDAVFSPPRPLPNATVAIPRSAQATYWWLQLIGRLKSGMTIERVSANFTTVFENTARDGMAAFRASLSEADRQLSFNRQRGNAVPTLAVRSAAHGFYDLDTQARRSAGFLGVVVVIVLLIVCANVANLLLSRATTRYREIAVRMSIGATRGRLVRQLLVESLLLSGLGGGLGVLVAYWCRGLLPFGQTAPLDWRVMAFAAAVSLLTGLVFGLVPALRATRVDLSSSMKEGGRGATGTRNWLSKGLLVLQVAMSLVLVIGAGLFLRTLRNLESVDVGFNARNLLMFSINPSLNRYDPDRSEAVFQRALERVGRLPGVQGAALTRTTLLSGSTSTSSIYRQGQTSDKATIEDMYMMAVSPGFLTTMEIPLLSGRDCSVHDRRTTPKVALLNEAAARKMFPQGGAVGGRVGNSFERSGEIEIIGIVRDTKYDTVRTAGPPTMYNCLLQQPLQNANIVMRTAGDPRTMADAVRAAMKDVDATLPIQRFTSQTEQIAKRFTQERLLATAYAFFGALALLLACIGLFGLMSYNVSRRVNEIGIRMALGAQRGAVLMLILRESMWLVGLGVGLGLVGALAAGNLVNAVLFGVTARDVPTMAGAAAIIVVVAAIAAYVPARRAARVDPMVALHQP